MKNFQTFAYIKKDSFCDRYERRLLKNIICKNKLGVLQIEFLLSDQICSVFLLNISKWNIESIID